eukprot:1234415-Pleurochrysis_carterae.AAC.6
MVYTSIGDAATAHSLWHTQGKSATQQSVFNVTCDHSRRILHVVDHSHPGPRNDKTMVHFDDFFMGMRTSKLSSNVDQAPSWHHSHAPGPVR